MTNVDSKRAAWLAELKKQARQEKKERQKAGNQKNRNHHGMVKLGIADQIYGGKK